MLSATGSMVMQQECIRCIMHESLLVSKCLARVSRIEHGKQNALQEPVIR